MHGSRPNPLQLAPDAYAALVGVERYLAHCGLEQSLLHLVKLRASQINGCASCLNMHSRDARRHGETEQRLYLLNAWREAGLYMPREQAALAWTECLTLVAARGAPDAEYAALAALFTPAEIAHLTTAIGMINLWNRLMIAGRVPPAEPATRS
ncbi:MAG TPA: carboxymuconolactone decarboxylase family protein [Acetobacteraceae bacterium]|nr:carboxymuconolactone decarboxylase family protein [Acetobacteraceae bacterium]